MNGLAGNGPITAEKTASGLPTCCREISHDPFNASTGKYPPFSSITSAAAPASSKSACATRGIEKRPRPNRPAGAFRISHCQGKNHAIGQQDRLQPRQRHKIDGASQYEDYEIQCDPSRPLRASKSSSRERIPPHTKRSSKVSADSYRPANTAESILVEEIAQTFWRLQRARALEAEAFLMLSGGADPIIPFNAESARFDNIRRYMTTIERAYHRAIAQLERTQAIRAKNPAPTALALFRKIVRTVVQLEQKPEINLTNLPEIIPRTRDNPPIRLQNCPC